VRTFATRPCKCLYHGCEPSGGDSRTVLDSPSTPPFLATARPLRRLQILKSTSNLAVVHWGGRKTRGRPQARRMLALAVFGSLQPAFPDRQPRHGTMIRTVRVVETKTDDQVITGVGLRCVVRFRRRRCRSPFPGRPITFPSFGRVPHQASRPRARRRPATSSTLRGAGGRELGRYVARRLRMRVRGSRVGVGGPAAAREPGIDRCLSKSAR
jgi:hypothetical protein